MPAIIELGGKTYTAIISAGAVEKIEEITDKGYQTIRNGAVRGKVTCLVPFLFGCIFGQLPPDTSVSWMWEKMGLVDPADMDLAIDNACDQSFPVICALLKIDTPTPQETTGDQKNASTPAKNAGPTTVISSTVF